jgi:cytochrome c oxidase subunit 2
LNLLLRAFSAAGLIALSVGAASAAPLQYLSGAGGQTRPVVALTWGVLVVSVLVILIIAGLLVGAIWHRPGLRMTVGEPGPVLPDEGGLNWLWIGVSLSALALLVTVVWTVKVLADIERPAIASGITIEVTGRQWWWQARYAADTPARGFVTANEIHIPVGQLVRLKLKGGDVIHSFWVPQLGGKMDAIPGQTNETWLSAARPGTFLGQCAEYCGQQHAKMALRVIAQPPAEFAAWRTHQQDAAPAAPAIFTAQCGRCHAVRGTDAIGSFGPDLSHLMQRQTLASGVLPNDPATLAHWIADPQALKPGNRMPAVKLSDGESAQINAYLKTLN